MTKRIISFIVAFIITLSTGLIVTAQEGNSYKNINAEFSDKKGIIESLKIMVKDNHVYADAYQLGERLGYTVEVGDSSVSIFNKSKNPDLPLVILTFELNSTNVNYLLVNKHLTYQGPFEAVKDSQGTWIPLKYTLYALGSSILIENNVAMISMPKKHLTDLIFEIAKNQEVIHFDFLEDTAYNQGDINWLTAAGLTDFLNGFLQLEPEAISAVIEKLLWKPVDAYNEKYGEEITKLFCTNSDRELEKINEEIAALNDVLDPKGNFGSALSKIKLSADYSESFFDNERNKLLMELEENNSDLSKNSPEYIQIERALKKNSLTSDMCEVALDAQKKIQSTTQFLDILSVISSAAGYLDEFSSQDSYAVQALLKYFSQISDSGSMGDAMVDSMRSEAELFNSNILNYSVQEFIKNNLVDCIQNNIPISQLLATQSNIVLLAWNIISAVVPFISDGLDFGHLFNLALYANLFQSESYNNYLEYKFKIFTQQDTITSSDLYTLSQFLYTFLKSAYITRDAAIGAFKSIQSYNSGMEDFLNELVQPQDSIAQYLADLKMMSEDNEDYSLGFLPESSEKLVNNYDDSDLLKLAGYDVQIPHAPGSSEQMSGVFDPAKVPADAVELNGHYYYLYDLGAGTTWQDAEEYCESLGGYLATVTSQEENDFLYSALRNNFNHESAYIGLSEQDEEDTCSWINGEKTAYTNWNPAEPNNDDEDYAMFYYKYPDGTWNDGDFGGLTVNGGTAFICEWGEY